MHPSPALLHRCSRDAERVLGALAAVIFSYVAVQKLLDLCRRCLGLGASFENWVYSGMHRLLAPFVCGQLVALRSVFVKFGQYLGGRSDVTPPEWAQELVVLQDDLPPCGARYVRSTLKAELGRDHAKLFSEFEMSPMASASVAQVHYARLAPEAGEREGRAVVVKLQHKGVEPLMRADMVAAIRIARLWRWLNPAYGIIYTVLTSWEHEMFKELDFSIEAANLTTVSSNLRAANIEAVVPTPILGHVARRAFAMSFEEGFKVTDAEALAAHGVDCEALMVRIVQIYAQQLFVDGFFNADPHAGNLLVQVRNGRALPVLLDFGMTVSLTETQRIGYARLAYAAQQMDLFALQAAVKSLGVVTNQTDEDPARDLAFWRFFLRDTGSRNEARAQATSFFSERAAERKQDKAEGRDGRKLENLPPSLVFFWRVIGLLRGLCTTLGVTVPYMELLAAHAKIALASLTPAPQHALSLSPPQTWLPVNIPGANLHQRLCLLLHQLCEEGTITAGVQVCVRRGSSVLAEGSAGFCGATDPRALTCETAMPLLELSALLPVFTLHALVRDGKLDYCHTLTSLWPEGDFDARKGETLRDALAHKVELHGRSSWEQAAKRLSSLDTQMKLLASAQAASRGAEADSSTGATARGPSPDGVSGAEGVETKPRSSGLAYGTLLGAIVQSHARRRPLEAGAALPGYTDEVRARLLVPHGLDKSLWPGELPADVSERVAQVSTGFASQLQRLISLAKEGAAGVAPDASMGGAAVNGAMNGASGGHDAASAKDGAPGTSASGGGHASLASTASSAGAFAGDAAGKGVAAQFAHELPMHAGMVNASEVREGVIPAFNAFGNARGEPSFPHVCPVPPRAMPTHSTLPRLGTLYIKPRHEASAASLSLRVPAQRSASCSPPRRTAASHLPARCATKSASRSRYCTASAGESRRRRALSLHQGPALLTSASQRVRVAQVGPRAPVLPLPRWPRALRAGPPFFRRLGGLLLPAKPGGGGRASQRLPARVFCYAAHSCSDIVGAEAWTAGLSRGRPFLSCIFPRPQPPTR